MIIKSVYLFLLLIINCVSWLTANLLLTFMDTIYEIGRASAGKKDKGCKGFCLQMDWRC